MTDPDIIDQAVSALEMHQMEWIDHELGFDCGCNEHGMRGPWHTLTQALRHQAQALAEAGLLTPKCDRECEALRDWDALVRERDEAQAEQDRLADIIKGLYETIDDERATIRKLVRKCGELRVSRAQLASELESRRPGRLTAERDEAYAALDRVRAAADTLTWQNDYGDAQQIIYAAIVGEDQS